MSAPVGVNLAPLGVAQRARFFQRFPHTQSLGLAASRHAQRTVETHAVCGCLYLPGGAGTGQRLRVLEALAFLIRLGLQRLLPNHRQPMRSSQQRRFFACPGGQKPPEGAGRSYCGWRGGGACRGSESVATAAATAPPKAPPRMALSWSPTSFPIAAPAAPPSPPPMAASIVEFPAFAVAVRSTADSQEYRMRVVTWESSETKDRLRVMG